LYFVLLFRESIALSVLFYELNLKSLIVKNERNRRKRNKLFIRIKFHTVSLVHEIYYMHNRHLDARSLAPSPAKRGLLIVLQTERILLVGSWRSRMIDWYVNNIYRDGRGGWNWLTDIYIYVTSYLSDGDPELNAYNYMVFDNHTCCSKNTIWQLLKPKF